MEEELQLERDVLAARNDDFQMSMDEAFVMSGQLDQLLEQPSSEVKSSPENSQAFERSAAIVAHHELAPEAELSNDSAKVVAKLEVSTKFDDLESWVSPDERDFRRSLHTLHDQSHLLKTTILPALEAVRVAQSDNKNADEVKRTHEVLQQTNRELYHTQCNLMAKTIADGKRMLMSMEAAHAAMVQFDVLQPWQPPAYALGDQYMDIDLSMFETSMDTCVSAGDAKTSASAGAGSAGTSLMSMMQRQLPSPLRASVEQILPPVSSVIPQRQLQLPIIVCYAKMYYDPFFVVIYEVSRYPNEKVIASQLKVLEKHQHLAQQDPQVLHQATINKRLKEAHMLEEEFKGFAWEMLQENLRRSAEFQNAHMYSTISAEDQAAHDKEMSEWLQAQWEPRMIKFHHEMEKILDDSKQRAPAAKQLPRRIHKVRECAWISKHRIKFLKRTFVKKTGITPEEQRLLLTYWICPKHRGGAGIVPGYQRFGPESAACKENLVSDVGKTVVHNGYTLITPISSFNTNDKLFLGGDDQAQGLGMTMAHSKSQRADWDLMKRDPNLEILPMQDLRVPGVMDKVYELIHQYDLADEFLHDFDREPKNRVYKTVHVRGPPAAKAADGDIVQTGDVLTKDLPGIGTWLVDPVTGALSERVDRRKGAMNKSGTGGERLSAATKKRAASAASSAGAGMGLDFLGGPSGGGKPGGKKRGRPSNVELQRRRLLQMEQERLEQEDDDENADASYYNHQMVNFQQQQRQMGAGAGGGYGFEMGHDGTFSGVGAGAGSGSGIGGASGIGGSSWQLETGAVLPYGSIAGSASGFDPTDFGMSGSLGGWQHQAPPPQLYANDALGLADPSAGAGAAAAADVRPRHQRDFFASGGTGGGLFPPLDTHRGAAAMNATSDGSLVLSTPPSATRGLSHDRPPPTLYSPLRPQQGQHRDVDLSGMMQQATQAPSGSLMS